jgi:EpsI family protein
MKSSWRLAIFVIAIVAVGALVNGWAYLGEAHVNRSELKGFPTKVGNWQQVGADTHFDSETLKVLRASDYLSRDYRRSDGQIANFYVGYYATQRDGATYHSPLNCLPGTGWMLNEPGKITITRPDGSSFVANRYIIENGDFRRAMIYWYQGRGRAVASEYWGKVYTVIDSVRLRRSDAAMVRVTVPVVGSDASAIEAAAEIAATASPALSEFVPD